ncbi:hypothetical protein [Pleurocapsa sp. FMAR1]|uniref:hypothetical protein n=1 Tax=Pleurocapsa sp. FMAR1 TaxID=3040204 RepID=UPI0029C851AA|nr:hypothetical protein [Pleurocapsa sp. FMAR1]
MKRSFRQQKGFSLDINTVEIIEAKALEDKTSYSRALDVIVQDWEKYETVVVDPKDGTVTMHEATELMWAKILGFICAFDDEMLEVLLKVRIKKRKEMGEEAN